MSNHPINDYVGVSKNCVSLNTLLNHDFPMMFFPFWGAYPILRQAQIVIVGKNILLDPHEILLNPHF